MTLQIRDFVYLDVDRLKSIIAQTEEGLVESAGHAQATTREFGAKGEGGVFGFLKTVGEANFLWEKQQTETRTLHDYIYNKVEETLIDNELLVSVPGHVKEADIREDAFSQMVGPTSFILATGKVQINDFGSLQLMLEKNNELAKFIAYCAAYNLPDGTSKKARKQFILEQERTMKLERELVEGFQLIFELFYKDRIVIKIRPFDDYPEFRLVGNLDRDLLREDISSIIYKYGTSPISEWTIFAQVASIPTPDRPNEPKTNVGSEIELALQGVFDAYREIELMAQSVVYPEIAITPIAVYRH